MTAIQRKKHFYHYLIPEILGPYLRRASIFVNKSDPGLKRQAGRHILQWLEERDVNPNLLPEKMIIFAEGWHTNGSKLLPLKSGPFRPGRPVQVCILKWESEFVPLQTLGQNFSWMSTSLIMMAQPYTKLKAKALPVYYPSEGIHKRYLWFL